MATTLSILNYLAQPPGDLIYHLVIGLSTIFTMGGAILSRSDPAQNKPKRAFLIGCSILLLMQLGLFVMRFIDPLTGFIAFSLDHLLERLIATLTIIWIVWLFFSDDKRPVPKTIIIFLTFALLTFSILSWLILQRLALLPMVNPLLLDLLWQSIALVMILVGLLLALFFRLPLIKVLLIILLLLAGGHILQIILMNELRGQMGGVRLAQTLSLPMLLIFIAQFSPSKAKKQSNQVNQAETPAFYSEKGLTEITTDTKPALVNELLQINITKTNEEKVQAIARAISLSVVADICLLVSFPDEAGKLHIISGYDLIREIAHKPDTVAREDLPGVISAWQAQQPLTLTQDDAESRDAQTLAQLLNYHTIGNLFAYPLALPDNPLAGGIMFLSPYTGKHWGEKTHQLMDHIKDTLARVVFGPDERERAIQASKKAQHQLNRLIEASDKLRRLLTEKEALIREKETTIKGLKAKYQIDKMQSITSIEQLQGKIAELSTQVSGQGEVMSKLEQFQAENRQLTSERDQLRLELNRVTSMLKDLQAEIGQTGPIRLSLESQIISLDSIAANVRLQVASLLQKNNIDLEINNPDGRLMIKTDPELLQNALVELLTNAIFASEYGGMVSLEQKVSLEMGMLTIQVTDYGEGLTQTEQTALFSGQHVSIPGVGSVPSIRNAIRAIRVLNGKIWLKSKKVSFTTFRFQIPVRIID